jgi:predicted ATP-grasp superfamily ATP-dependent carboligase
MKLWIEHGFSRYPIAQRMMQADSDLELYTSERQTPPGATSLKIPSRDKIRWVQKINQVISEKEIDAFWPQELAKRDTSKIRCNVLRPTSVEKIALVDDKEQFDSWLEDDPYRFEQIAVIGADAVKDLFYARLEHEKTTCVKPVIGVNGSGYWTLTDKATNFLDDPDKRLINIEVWHQAQSAIERESAPRRHLVMEWLSGLEVSHDILCWNGKFLASASRTKLDSNHQMISNFHPTIEHAKSIVEKLKMHGIVSMQYRQRDDGSWKILEVNPRPAGGSIYSEDAGFGIISQWTKLVTGKISPSQVQQIEKSCKVRLERQIKIME